MNRKFVAGELLKVAKDLLAMPVGWEPVRKDVDVGMRNIEVHKSLTSYAPRLAAIIRKDTTNFLLKQGYRVTPGELTREWSQYLSYIDPRTNANKYHYYAVFSFADEVGNKRFVAVNCSGRIGIVERAYDLTKKYVGGPVESLPLAVRVAEKHMRPKISKGYQKVKMVRG